MKAENRKLVVVTIVAVVMTLCIASVAMGFTKPTDNTALGWNIYDILNKILTGPIGFAAGLGIIGYSVVLAVRGQLWGTIIGFLAGGALINAENLATSLGALF